MSRNKDGSITPSTVYKKTYPVLNLEELTKKLANYQDILQDQSTALKQKVTEEHTKYLAYKSQLQQLEKFKAEKGDKRKVDTDKKIKELEAFKKVIMAAAVEVENGPLDCFVKIYQSECKFQENPVTAKPVMLRLAIDPVKAKWLNGHLIADKTLHPIEEHLIEQAFINLSKFSSAESYLSLPDKDKAYANNVILVDIFPRKFDVTGSAQIITLERDEIETHTVVLWKTKNDELTLIDPTDQNFSSFLEGHRIEVNGKNCKIVAGQNPAEKLYSNDNKPTGYARYDEPMKPRDCVDIAVKIGFELGELQKIGTTIEGVKSATIKQISNIFSAKDAGLRKIADLNTRPLQSSDFETREKAQKIIENYKKFPKADFKSVPTIEALKELTELLGDIAESEFGAEFL